MSSWNRFLRHAYFLFLVYLFLIGIFLISRGCYLFNVLNSAERDKFQQDILHAFITGLRFDTATACYALLIPLVISITSIVSAKADRFIYIFNKTYVAITAFVFVFISIVDFYYYSYFQSHINILIFGFFEDDTSAVLQSLKKDYPFVAILIAMGTVLIVSFYLFNWLQKKVQQKEFHYSRRKAVVTSLIFVILFAMGLRSSFGTFPVQMDDASISENSKVNLLPINGVFAFKDAWVYHKNVFNLQNYIDEARRMGYDSWDKPVFAKTDTNSVVKKSPPHVVFLLLESWSNNNLYYHNPKNNLLGALEKYWNSDIVFRNFLSGQNGTIGSLEGLLVNTPVSPLSQSPYSTTSFESSCAKPFLENDYYTTFITGGKVTWRSIDHFISRQYFEKVEGNADIKSAIPDAQECEWGVYDEYLFDNIFKKLKNATSPQFIFALTTTNHTPFSLPAHYKPYPVEFNQQTKVDHELAIRNLTNLQYTNDCLGRFLDDLKETPLAENTIVVATGDHNNMMLFDFDYSKTFYRYSVPLFMHVPAKYLSKSKVDTGRYGSHKDIFPTIYNLALDNGTYFDGGDNLLDSTRDVAGYYAMNIGASVAMTGTTTVFYNQNKYFSVDQNRILHSEKTSDGDELIRKARENYAKLIYHLRDEINKKHDSVFTTTN